MKKLYAIRLRGDKQIRYVGRTIHASDFVWARSLDEAKREAWAKYAHCVNSEVCEIVKVSQFMMFRERS